MISNKLRQYNNLYTEITAVYHDLAVKLGITDSAATILYILCTFGGSYPLGEICRRSGMSKQTANSAIRKLEQQGMVYLQAIDGRAKRVCLTPAGEKCAGETVMRIMKAEDEVYGSWSEEELETYLALTERFLTQLKEKAEHLS